MSTHNLGITQTIPDYPRRSGRTRTHRMLTANDGPLACGRDCFIVYGAVSGRDIEDQIRRICTEAGVTTTSTRANVVIVDGAKGAGTFSITLISCRHPDIISAHGRFGVRQSDKPVYVDHYVWEVL